MEAIRNHFVNFFRPQVLRVLQEWHQGSTEVLATK